MRDFLSEKYKDLNEVSEKFNEDYVGANPYPNISFEDFFKENVLNGVLKEFPDLSKKSSVKFDNPNEKKLATKGENLFGQNTKDLLHYLNSQPFLDFLGDLTGIENLIPDPYFVGGGYHEIKKGGFLKIHADFNKHYNNNLDRRLNLLIYLNKDWEEEYGGHFELWDTEMKGCVKKIRPDFNKIAIFSTTSDSYHGHPDTLNCPENRSRKSIALYYYTNGRPEEEIKQDQDTHGTIFMSRKQDQKMKRFNLLKKVLIDITPPVLFKVAKKIFLRNKI